ncbi:dermonecrotic toxin domain-containing protein, partial [Pseudomonas sp. BF-B-15]
MSTEQNTPASSNAADQETLRLIAPVVVTACPGLQEEAHAVASEILQKHGITHLDPDQVWWHRFNNVSASSTKAFLGWEHAPKPSESLTLTQLVIHRYRVTDQDDALELDSNGGFYTADANASIYNETNEVRMYPRQVLADLWEKNLSQRYLDKLNAFWASHFDDYRTLAKCNYLSKAVEARQNGQLEEEDFQTVIRAVIGGASWPITLATLKAQTATPADLRVCALDVAGHVATDILRIVEPNGRQITYVPGAAEPFHVHPTLTDMHWWMLLQMNEEQPRTEFMTHFPLSVRKEVHDNITPLMNQLVGTWGKYDHHLINQKDITISGDVFTWQSRAVQHTMLEEADLTLVSNGQMRKQLWLGYLTAALHVFGPLAVLGWPIALPVIGASIAAMGLNIDKAVNGKTAAERKAGIIGAVLDGINVLFNIPLLKDASVLDEAAAEAAEMADLEKSLDPEETVDTQEPQSPDESDDVTLQPRELPGQPDATAQALEVPEHWQSNEILESYPMATNGKFQSVYTLDSQPSNAILINEQAYFVRFEADANGGGTWAIIDPQNPNAFTGSIPVRLNAEGEWELAPKSGLMGGGKGPSKLV